VKGLTGIDGSLFRTEQAEAAPSPRKFIGAEKSNANLFSKAKNVIASAFSVPTLSLVAPVSGIAGVIFLGLGWIGRRF